MSETEFATIMRNILMSIDGHREVVLRWGLDPNTITPREFALITRIEHLRELAYVLALCDGESLECCEHDFNRAAEINALLTQRLEGVTR